MNNSSSTLSSNKPINPLSYSYQDLRTKILTMSFWGTAIAGLLVLAEIFGHANPISIGVVAAAYVVILVAAIFRFPYSIKAWMLLAVIFGLGLFELLQLGIFGNGRIFLLALALLAAMLFDRKVFFIVLGVSIFSLVLTGWLFSLRLLSVASQEVTAGKLATWITETLLLVLVTIGLEEGWNWLKKEFIVTQSTLKNAMSTLNNERVNLDTRVAERTKETAALADFQKNRAERYLAIYEIMQSAAPIQDPNELMNVLVRQVGERFNLYHTGIFLNSENDGISVLRAAYGPGSERLLAKGYKVTLDQSGIINSVASTGLPRIAKKVKDDILFESNPELPETRSLLALPLKINHRTIGVLDLESKIEGGFTEYDLESMSTLAGQVAAAIENVQISSETRQALSEARVVYGHYMRQAWEQIATEKRTIGYRYAASKVDSLDAPLDLPEIRSALNSGQPIISPEEKPTIAIPLKLRDEVIGVLDIRSNNPDRKWNENELALIQAIAERVSLALENARLFEETTRRADRERTVSEITTHIRSTTDPEAMLKTALDELKRALGAKDIRIRPYTPPTAGQTGN